jgi:hypothetical protein
MQRPSPSVYYKEQYNADPKGTTVSLGRRGKEKEQERGNARPGARIIIGRSGKRDSLRTQAKERKKSG